MELAWIILKGALWRKFPGSWVWTAIPDCFPSSPSFIFKQQCKDSIRTFSVRWLHDMKCSYHVFSQCLSQGDIVSFLFTHCWKLRASCGLWCGWLSVPGTHRKRKGLGELADHGVCSPRIALPWKDCLDIRQLHPEGAELFTSSIISGCCFVSH